MNQNKLKVYFQKHILDDLIINKLNEIIKLQDIIKTNDLNYKSQQKSL